MNLPNYIKEREEAFKQTKFAKGGGACFECCDYEGMYTDLLTFHQESLSGLIQLIREWAGERKLGGHEDTRRAEQRYYSAGHDTMITDLLSFLETLPPPELSKAGGCCDKCKAVGQPGMITTPWCGKLGQCLCHDSRPREKNHND